MYGQQFKKIRKRLNLSLKDVASNIVSISTLSRWENGKEDMLFTKLLQLLQKVDTTPLEFFSYLPVSHSNSIDFEHQIALLQLNNDTISLYKIYLNNISNYHKTKNNLYLLHGIIAADIFYGLTNKKIAKDAYIQEAYAILSDDLECNYKTIKLLGNTVRLLPTNKVYAITNLLLNNIDHIKDKSLRNYHFAWMTILNAFITLIMKDSASALKLSRKIELLSIPNDQPLISIRKHFFMLLIKFKTQSNSDSTEIEKYIQTLKELDLTAIAESFENIFSELKSIN